MELQILPISNFWSFSIRCLVRFSDSLALGASGLGNLTICCLASVSLSHIRVIQISQPLSEIPGQGDGVQREVRGVGGGRQGPGRLPPLEQRRGPREAELEPKLRLCRPRFMLKTVKNLKWMRGLLKWNLIIVHIFTIFQDQHQGWEFLVARKSKQHISDLLLIPPTSVAQNIDCLNGW